MRAKPRVEGMFLKGLRSKYITRKSLSEANEARKNEDIHKIIDIGRVFLQKELPESPLKRDTPCIDDRKSEQSSISFREVSSDSSEDREQFPLSPISFALTSDEGTCSTLEDSQPRTIKSSKLDLEEEFEKFSLNYENAVGEHVLLNLPENGVLEDAIEALRKTLKNQKNDSENVTDQFKGDETERLTDFKFLPQDSESSEAVNFVESFISPEKFLTQESHYFDGDFMEKPLGNELIMADLEPENYNHPSFMTAIENDGRSESLNIFQFQGNNSEKPAKILSITTPPIQFYRRNMF